jgi:ethanolamine ammonia-lyase large subunit
MPHAETGCCQQQIREAGCARHTPVNHVLRHHHRPAPLPFDDLKTLLARATPLRSGDQLAGMAASSAEERVAAQMCLADVPLRTFLKKC